MTTIRAIRQADQSSAVEIPLCGSKVSAGFPSPANDFIEGRLDLNRHLIRHPASTFFVQVEGSSMIEAGINHGDLLLVDRAIEPTDGCIVIAILDDEFTVKRLRKNQEGCFLLPANPAYAPIRLQDDMTLQIWGVVSYVIHKAQ